jgi:metal-dependent amidase/aminoacylase/carboxypeptidase family protein
MVVGIQTIVSRLNNPVQPLVISICKIEGGTGYNVIPERVSLEGTIRSVDEEGRDKAHKGLKDIARGIEAAHNVQVQLEVLSENRPLRCNDQIVAFVDRTLSEQFSTDKVIRISSPSLGADDFAAFAERVPAAYVRIGCYDEDRGHVHGLHAPHFDFDEGLLVEGTRVLAFLVARSLTTNLRL